MNLNKKIAIIGAGNIGQAIYRGMTASGVDQSNFFLTRRRVEFLEECAKKGAQISASNPDAAKKADIIILTVLPKQLKGILEEIKSVLSSEKIIVSVVTAYSISVIKQFT